MLPIPSPLTQFNDNAGQALNDGYLYIGQVNDNPETAPQTVYWDSDGTQPAAQPLRTIGGHVTRNGNPANIFIGTAYSLVIKNKNGVLLFYGPDSNKFDSSVTIGGLANNLQRVVGSVAQLKALNKTAYTQALLTGYYVPGDGGGGNYYYDPNDTTSSDNGGTIIVASDGARWKLAYVDSVDLRQFGAKGDGLNDDTVAIQNACNVDKLKITVRPGTYKITSTITIGNGTSGTVSTVNGVSLACGGGGVTASEFNPSGGNVTFVWGGGAMGQMIRINGPVYGINISGLTLDCANIASTGIYAKHNNSCVWTNVLVKQYRGDAYFWGAYQTPTAMAVGASNSTYTNVSSKQPGAGGSGGVFGEATGNVGNLDVARNIWMNCEFWRDGTTAATYSAKLQFIDNCTFIECETTAQGGSLGIGVYAVPPTGTGISGFPAAITFLNCPIIGGFSAAPGWQANEGFLFWPYPVGDGEPVPSSTLPKQVYGITSKGDYFGGFSIGVNGTPITSHLSATAVLSFGSMPAGTTLDRAVTVTGAEVGDTVVVSAQTGAQPSGFILSGYVNAANNVNVRWLNASGGTASAPSIGYRVDVWKH